MGSQGVDTKEGRRAGWEAGGVRWGMMGKNAKIQKDG